MEAFRSDVAVKLRGASYGDRAVLAGHLEGLRSDHAARLAHYEHLEQQQFPHPDRLGPVERDQWLVLRGGIRLEQFWIDWITECLQAQQMEALA